MADPVYFVVQRGASGNEHPALIRDRLPSSLTRKVGKASRELSPLVYALRLDILPDAQRWLAMPLPQLFEWFEAARWANDLPPSNIVPPVKGGGEASRRVLGDWWEPPPRTWADRDPDPYPVPGAIRPRPAAPAFIGDRDAVAPDPARAEEAAPANSGRYLRLLPDTAAAEAPI